MQIAFLLVLCVGTLALAGSILPPDGLRTLLQLSSPRQSQPSQPGVSLQPGLPPFSPPLGPQQATDTVPPDEPTAEPTGQSTEPSDLAVIAPTATSSPIPTPTTAPVLLPTPTPTPALAFELAPAFVELSGFSHQWQTWNNCGPATLAMNLSFFGSGLDQADIGAVLRQYPDDKNVSPQELEAFARAQGYRAQIRVNGNAEMLKLLLSNEIPVLIETWLEPEPNDGLGHYRLLTGYDDALQRWIAFDSYVSTNLVSQNGEVYQGIYLPYAETETLWNVFNHTYVLIYPPEREPAVQEILGDTFALDGMWNQALADAQAAVDAAPDDPFMWFNLGTTLTHFGRYAEAAIAYDRAREIGLPWRMLWYQFGPFESYHAVGRYQDVIDLANETLAIVDGIEELWYWKGQSFAALGDSGAAIQAWQRAVELKPDYTEALAALQPTGS